MSQINHINVFSQIYSLCEKHFSRQRSVNVADAFYLLDFTVRNVTIVFTNDVLTKCRGCVIKYTWIVITSFYQLRILTVALQMRMVQDWVIKKGKYMLLAVVGLFSDGNCFKQILHTGYKFRIRFFRHPRSLNQQDRSNSAPNVCINSVRLTADQSRLLQLARGPIDFVSKINNKIISKISLERYFFSFQTQSTQEHSHSTQASPTNTLKHVKRQRARSADESNKNLLSPREQKPTDENWVRIYL